MFKKFKTMSKEKKINIEDGNAKEQVLNENAEQNDTQNNEEPKAEETNTEDADNKAADADSKTDNTDNAAESEEADPLAKAQQEVEELKSNCSIRLQNLRITASAP